MHAREPTLSRMVPLVAMGAAPPLVLIWAMMTAGPALPVVTLLGMTLVWYAAALGGLTEEAKVQAARRAAQEAAARAAAAEPQLELVEVLPIPSVAMAFGVVSAMGVCPLGFRPGSTWAIDEEGHLSRPLCRPAVAAVLDISSQGAEASCRCPLGDRALIFALQRDMALAAPGVN